jgi:hypothetical protein
LRRIASVEVLVSVIGTGLPEALPKHHCGLSGEMSSGLCVRSSLYAGHASAINERIDARAWHDPFSRATVFDCPQSEAMLIELQMVA